MISIKTLLNRYGSILGLKLCAGQGGLSRKISVPEVQRPGLSLSGYLRGYTQRRVLIFGKAELQYLRDLKEETRFSRLGSVLSKKVPAVIVARNYSPPKLLKDLCEKHSIPLFRVPMKTMEVFSKLTVILSEEFAGSLSCHGTLVEVFGMGVLIQGDSSIGKSEAALGLIERGHRLISDDVVKIKKREGSYLEGRGTDLNRHLLEIRGIGIINVAHFYGAVCVSDKQQIDLIVKLEAWDDTHFYDRVGLEEKVKDVLGIKVPYHTLPLKPGRDVVQLLETIVMNVRLKNMGYHSAKEFNRKLLDVLSKKSTYEKKRSHLRKF